MSSLFYEPFYRSDSPYINQFTSADTIIPNPADPQSWNRYSYVNNNPLRYTDPTGHMLDYGGNEGGGGCNNISCFPTPPNNSPGGSGNGGSGGNGNGSHDTDGDSIPDIPDSDIGPVGLSNNFTSLCPSTQTPVECFYLRQPYDLIDGPLDVSFDEMQLFLLAVFFDVKGRNNSGIRYFGRLNYDTPFWNGYGLVPGDVCVAGTCYERQEVNYVAQGMWAADSGQTLGQSHTSVEVWKNLIWDEEPSPATYYWNDVGYHAYNALNPYYGELSVIFK